MLTENKELANDSAEATAETQVQESEHLQTAECPAAVDNKLPVSADEKSATEPAVEPVASTEPEVPATTEAVAPDDKPTVEAEGKEADAKVDELKGEEVAKEAGEQQEAPVSTDACQVVKKDATESATDEPANEQVKANGKHPKEAGDKELAIESTDDTNGVCKRKAADVVETIEEEKSPKKAKVVDEADNQKPIEETAA